MFDRGALAIAAIVLLVYGCVLAWRSSESTFVIVVGAVVLLAAVFPWDRLIFRHNGYEVELVSALQAIGAGAASASDKLAPLAEDESLPEETRKAVEAIDKELRQVAAVPSGFLADTVLPLELAEGGSDLLSARIASFASHSHPPDSPDQVILRF